MGQSDASRPAPGVVMRATHEKALEHIRFSDLVGHALDVS